MFWLGVNALLAATIVYEAVTVGQPTPNVTDEQLARARAAQAAIPQVGQLAPDFSLAAAGGSGEVTLKSLRGKPVVLVFGSHTCPIFRGHASGLNAACEQVPGPGGVSVRLHPRGPPRRRRRHS
jgi:hypothetical protein